MNLSIKKTVGIGAIVLASLIVGVAIMEIGLRVLGISYPAFMMLDPVRGNSLFPGAEGWQIREGRAYVRINRYGLRDKEYSPTKPPGTFRIAVLGDSFAEAMQVPRENAFWSVMENNLGRCAGFAGRPVEVINFGISGHGTAQQLLTLRENVWKFDPDLVLLAFYTGNDIRNNSRALERSPYRPYFVLRDGRLVLDSSFSRRADFTPEQLERNKTRIEWINRSYVLQILREARNRLSELKSVSSGPQIGEAGVNDQVFRAPDSKDWRQAWQVTEALLLRMTEEIVARGKTFWIATLTSGRQIHPDKALRRRYAKSLGVADLDYPDRRIAAFGKVNDIPVITLLDPFRGYVDAKGVFLHGFDGRGAGHWNREGHRLGGTIIAKRICDAAQNNIKPTNLQTGK
jgi:hypothetical protein